MTPSDFRGVYAIIPTPAKEGADRWDAVDTVDLAETARVINRLIADGVHGLIVLGTTGECATLTGGEYEGFVACVLETVKKRLPTFIGTTALGTHEVVRRTRFAAERGGADERRKALLDRLQHAGDEAFVLATRERGALARRSQDDEPMDAVSDEAIDHARRLSKVHRIDGVPTIRPFFRRGRDNGVNPAEVGRPHHWLFSDRQGDVGEALVAGVVEPVHGITRMHAEPSGSHGLAFLAFHFDLASSRDDEPGMARLWMLVRFLGLAGRQGDHHRAEVVADIHAAGALIRGTDDDVVGNAKKPDRRIGLWPIVITSGDDLHVVHLTNPPQAAPNAAPKVYVEGKPSQPDEACAAFHAA